MPKHTPGPWIVREMNNGDLVIGTQPTDSKGIAIAVAIVPDTFTGNTDESEANAWLASYAPAMLELIELTLKDLEIRADVDDSGLKVFNISHHVYLRLITLRDQASGLIRDNKKARRERDNRDYL